MTRINVIPPSRLSSKHLVAEYRELPRVFGLVLKAIERGEKPNLVGQYSMGKGHVRFFFPRLQWLLTRYDNLVVEMKRRGYRPRYAQPARIDDIPREWWGDWKPTAVDIETNMVRLRERDAQHYSAK